MINRRAVVAAAVGMIVALAVGAILLKPGRPVRVEIPDGLSARQTAELLSKNGIVISSRGFRLFLKVSGFERKLHPGTYTFREREFPTEVVRKLALSLTDDVKVTIPEGYRASQTAEKLAFYEIADAKEVERLAAEQGLEGHLYPSTYHLPPGLGAQRALDKLVAEFDRRIGAAYATAAPKPTIKLKDALIVASIVEREAVHNAERPMIAAVYLNRVKKRMKLQADPTVQYAVGEWKKGLTRDDLKTDSPYNTYAHYGLPPGPICSPGLDSFFAVLRPAQTDALYFVADLKGGHIFSATNEEHSAASRRYRRELKKIKQKLREQAPPGLPQ